VCNILDFETGKNETKIPSEMKNRKQETGKQFISFGVFTAVTMNNAVLWDIKTKFLPHR
jgi:hypothetical protein